jgi:hypothetical protein
VTTPVRGVPWPARCIRTFPGGLRQVGEARSFVAAVLAGCPARDTLLTCVSELAANAVEHTASGRGGTFTVEVGRRDGIAYVSVTDDGSPASPAVADAGPLAEGGRGLALVAACSSRWGFCDGAGGRTVWAEVTWPVAVREPGAGRRVTTGIWQDLWTSIVKCRSIA